MQDAALVLQGRFLVGLQRGAIDLLALEAPQIEQPELLLFGALEFLECRRRGAPLVIGNGGAGEQLAVAGESGQHVALRIGRKQELLLVLSVDIRQVRRQVFEQGHRHRPAADERARLAAAQDFTLDDQLAVFDIETSGFQQAADGRVIADIEDARHARAGFSGADGLRRGAAPQQQAEGVHHQGFAAAGLARQQVQSGVEADAQALHHGIVLNHQLQQHFDPIIAVFSVRFATRRLLPVRTRHCDRFEIRRRIDFRSSRCPFPPNECLGNGPAQRSRGDGCAGHPLRFFDFFLDRDFLQVAGLPRRAPSQ